MLRLLRAAAELHRRKDAVYGGAWKKRGEIFSIIPNIARKVDRIESVLEGRAIMDGESLLDTAIDLLVYCLKYETFLADQDNTIGGGVFAESGAVPPYSEGPGPVEHLLAKLATRTMPATVEVKMGAQAIVARFAVLECCFREAQSRAPLLDRLRATEGLVDATLALLGGLAEADGAAMNRFLSTHDVGGAAR
jgi:hypothetical protein